jgi:hypothetical protein
MAIEKSGAFSGFAIMNKLTGLLGITLLLLLHAPLAAQGQSFRYMDEAGQLHWVDSIQEVPRRYLNQVLAPTPVPTWKNGRPPKQPKPVKTKKPKPTPKPRKRPPEKAPKIERATFAPEAAPTVQIPVPGIFPPGLAPAQPVPVPQPEAQALTSQAPGGANPAVAAPGPAVPSSVSVQNEVAFEGAKAEASLAIVAQP